jgi:hypothetical protein
VLCCEKHETLLILAPWNDSKPNGLSDMIAILTLENAKEVLAQNAAGMPIPWSFIKESLFAFVDHLYSQNIVFAQALDSVTANTIHPIFENNQSIALSVNGDNVIVQHITLAKTTVGEHGQLKLAAGWNSVRSHVEKFLESLYVKNVFVAKAEGAATLFVSDRLKAGKNLQIKINGA